MAGTVAAVPVFFLRSTTEPFDTPKLSLLLIGVGICLLMLVRALPTGALLSAGGLVVPAGAVFVPLAIATVLSSHRSWELIGAHARYAGLIPYAATIIVGVLGAIAFAGRVHLLVWIISASTTVVGGYAILQMFGADPLDWFLSSYVASTLGHSNFSGAVLAMGLPAGLSLWMQDGRAPWFGRVAVVVMSVALIGSFSQGAWIAAVGGCAVGVSSMLSLRNPRARKVGNAIALAAALALVVPVIVAQMWPSGPLAASSTWTRGLHWRTALVMAADSPIVGHGANSYSLEASRYRSPAEAMTMGSADDPHSVPLGMVAHAGIPGAVGVIVLMVWLLRRLRSFPPDPSWAGLAGTTSAYLLIALVTVDHLVLRALFWACLGGLATYGTSVTWGQRRSRVPRSLIKLVLVLVGVGSVLLGGSILRADIHTVRAIAALDAEDPALARSEFNRAKGFGGQWEQRRLYGDAIGRAGFRNGVSDKELTDLYHAYEPIVALPEWSWRARFADWLTQWSLDRPSLIGSAREAWNDVLEVNPYDPRSGIALADLALVEGRPGSALAALARFEGQLAATYPPGVLSYPDYWGALAIAREFAGDEVGGREALAQAEAVGSEACHTLIARMLLVVEKDGTERLIASFVCPRIALALLDRERTVRNHQ